MAARKIVIDTDPGFDDVLAILLALSAPPDKLEVLLIAVTYGNVDLHNCLRNIISLFHYVGKEIAWRESVGRDLGFETLRKSKPLLAVGPEHPLDDNAAMADLIGQPSQSTPAMTWQRLLKVAEESSAPEQVDIIAKELKNPTSLFTQSQMPAHLEILRLLRDNEPNSITIVAIGPMTNIALAAAEDPETFLKVKEIVVMGGYINQTDNAALQPPLRVAEAPNAPEPPFRLTRQPPGPIRDSLNMRNQVAPVADFNTFADPIAAARVYALTSPTPHAMMPLALPLPLHQEQDVGPVPCLPSYPENLPRRLNVTLFPMDITGKHVLARGDVEASLAPLLAAKSPLAGWVWAFMQHVFDKIVSVSPGVTRDAVVVPVHDMLPIWYCVDCDDPRWKVSKGEDLRVEAVGQWTRGSFVADRRELAQGKAERNGNRLKCCIDTPGQEVFGGLLFKRVFDS